MYISVLMINSTEPWVEYVLADSVNYWESKTPPSRPDVLKLTDVQGDERPSILEYDLYLVLGNHVSGVFDIRTQWNFSS